jgi:nucleoside-diphosphate-sugar epimerase
VLILGCGYLGRAVLSEAQKQNLSVTATTRREGHAVELTQAGATPLVLSSLTPESLAEHVDSATAIVVTFPPDGRTDALCAELARRAFAAVYISSTGVYGSRSGRIDDTTEPAPDSDKARARLAAEQAWRSASATVLRVAAIYGPHRGMHERVRSGSARIAGDGTHHVCRIHVEDLAALVLRCLTLRLGPETYVVADDEPAQQGEVVRYLAQQLGLPEPLSVPLEAAPETLRHDRQVDASRVKRDAQLAFRYPNYRAGFEACLQAEREVGP